ncbi:uncharacterized protein BXZ73DRAFT_58728, partial [Epithele typhae]|uniref:uncharacterized protein n=1 Tax=Epithele typhae TaxID=378194 RepID=UPI0020087FA6
LAFQLYADKTRLSSFGTRKGYPIIARLANLPSHIRNGEGYGGGQVVGFLPIVQVEDDVEEGRLGFTALKRIVWHKSFHILLETFIKHAKLGYPVECGDGLLRVLWAIILILTADYEEQCVMSLIRGVKGACPCPICLVPSKEQVTLGTTTLHPLRTASESSSIVLSNRSKQEKEDACKAIGLRPLTNVFWDVPFSDPHQTLSWDRLHAYHGGLFSDHLFAEFQKVMEARPSYQRLDVNEAFDKVPRWSNLNHFSEVTSVNFTDGSKYEDISKILVPAAYTLFQARAFQNSREYILMKCIRLYNILDIYSGFECHTLTTVDCFSATLPLFSDAIKYLRVHPDKNWNFPKMHTQQHAPDDILQKGVTLNTTSKPFEKSHGVLKDIFEQRTNFKNVEEQIARYEQQLSIAKQIRFKLQALQGLENLPQGPPAPNTSDFQFSHVYLGSRSAATPLATIIAVNNMPLHFHSKLQDFLEAQSATQGFFLDTSHPVSLNFHILLAGWVTECAQIIMSRYLKVSYRSQVTWKSETDYLRCSEQFHNVPRYDYIIYQLSSGHLAFAKMRLVFAISIADTLYPIIYAERLNFPPGPRTKIDKELGLHRLTDSTPPQDLFISALSVVRGALVMDDPGHGGLDRLVVDMVDADMFLRLKSGVPEWAE